MTQLVNQPLTHNKVDLQTLEHVLIRGNLSLLSPEQKLSYLQRLCESLGLNPLTRPIEYITLQGKEVLYARKDCCEQLRKIHNISITKVEITVTADSIIAEAYASNGSRTDYDIGVVPIYNLKGDQLANAQMKAVTKAKRRVTLSICGLGLLDESELDTIPNVHVTEVEPTFLTEEEYIHRLETAESLDELKMTFMDALKFAKAKKNMAFTQFFSDIKDKRKKELEEVNHEAI